MNWQKQLTVGWFTDLQSLRTLTDRFLYAITSAPQKMPFGIRYTAREMFRGLQVKFPGESEDSLAKVVLHMIYYRYLQPAVVLVSTHIPHFFL
jgi:Ras GTPase-activating-like protein IQGAP2/3